MVAKDGFAKNVRMECHEDADTSTASLVSESNQEQAMADSEGPRTSFEVTKSPTKVLEPLVHYNYNGNFHLASKSG